VLVIKKRVSKIVLAVILVFAVVATGTYAYLNRGYKYIKIKPQVSFGSAAERDLYTYIGKVHATRNQGVSTNSLSIPVSGDLPGGADVLSESVGMLMQYALEAGSQTLFEKQYLFLDEVFTVKKNIIVWKVDQDNNITNSNALIDDLRITGTLITAYEKWGTKKYLRKAIEIADGLKTYNMKNSTLVDYYDYKVEKSGDTLTLTYIDLETIKKLTVYDKEWEGIYNRSLDILQNGKADSNGIFFNLKYNVLNNTYMKVDKVNMIDQLIIAENLLKAGLKPEATLSWIANYFNYYGYIVNDYYVKDKKQASVNESPAVYALCSRVFLMAGDKIMAKKFYDRLMGNVFNARVIDKSSKYYGGFANKKTGESLSFDNLQALLTIRYRSDHLTK
jgi:hypothetical protein